MRYASHGRWVIFLTLLVALMLDVLPLPGWVIWLRPHWSLLVLLYWIMALPYCVGITYAFMVGVLLDLLNGTLLGEHAFAIVAVAYLAIKLHQLIRVYPLLQQTLVILLMMLLYQIIIFSIQSFIGESPHPLLYWLPVLVSAVLWPWLFVVLRDWRRRLRVT